MAVLCCGYCVLFRFDIREHMPPPSHNWCTKQHRSRVSRVCVLSIIIIHMYVYGLHGGKQQETMLRPFISSGAAARELFTIFPLQEELSHHHNQFECLLCASEMRWWWWCVSFFFAGAYQFQFSFGTLVCDLLHVQ